MKLELEDLKDLREQNQVLQQEVSDQKSHIDVLTMRLHVLKSKQPKLEADRKEESADAAVKGISISSSSMAAKQMLSDTQDAKDENAENDKNLLIDSMKRKILNLEKNVGVV